MLIGVIAARDVERETVGDEDIDAGSLALELPELYVDQELADAIELLSEGDREALPVLAAGSRRIVGWIDHRDVLRAYASRLGHPATSSEDRKPATNGRARSTEA